MHMYLIFTFINSVIFQPGHVLSTISAAFLSNFTQVLASYKTMHAHNPSASLLTVK